MRVSRLGLERAERLHGESRGKCAYKLGVHSRRCSSEGCSSEMSSGRGSWISISRIATAMSLECHNGKLAVRAQIPLYGPILARFQACVGKRPACAVTSVQCSRPAWRIARAQSRGWGLSSQATYSGAQFRRLIRHLHMSTYRRREAHPVCDRVRPRILLPDRQLAMR